MTSFRTQQTPSSQPIQLSQQQMQPRTNEESSEITKTATERFSARKNSDNASPRLSNVIDSVEQKKSAVNVTQGPLVQTVLESKRSISTNSESGHTKDYVSDKNQNEDNINNLPEIMTPQESFSRSGQYNCNTKSMDNNLITKGISVSNNNVDPAPTTNNVKVSNESAVQKEDLKGSSRLTKEMFSCSKDHENAEEIREKEKTLQENFPQKTLNNSPRKSMLSSLSINEEYFDEENWSEKIEKIYKVIKYTINSNEPLGLRVTDEGYDDDQVWSKLAYWIVSEVKAGTQAERLGINVGDVIYKVGGRVVTTDINFIDVWLEEKVKDKSLQIDIFTDSLPEEGKCKEDSNGDNKVSDDEIIQQEENILNTILLENVPPKSDNEIIQQKENGSNKNLVENAQPKSDKEITEQKENGSNKNLFENMSLKSDKEITQKKENGSKTNLVKNIPLKTPDLKNKFSIVPTADGLGILSLKQLRKKCDERVKEICEELCLLRPASVPTLANACDLIFTSLKYEMPPAVDSEELHEVEYKHQWLLGSKPLLRGPQLWMANRKFIRKKVADMLHDDDWLVSKQRRDALLEKQVENVKKYLKSWRSILSHTNKEDLLLEYVNKILDRFEKDHNNQRQGNLPIHRLTETYVHVIAHRLESKKMCPSVPQQVDEEKTEEKIEDVNKIILDHLQTIRYEVIPFVKNLNLVASAIYERLNFNFSLVTKDNVRTFSMVRNVLDDLEEDTNFLTTINEIHKVKAKMSIMTSTEHPSELIISNTQDVTPDTHVLVDKEVIKPCQSTKPDNMVSNSKIEAKIQLEDKNRKDKCTNKDDMLHEKNKNSKDIRKSQRIFSSSKDVGSRVYAEFTNQEYYWGVIGQVVKTKRAKHYKYKVLFEDGDVLDNITEDKVFTEEQYKDIFEEDPPLPTVTSEFTSSSRLRKRSESMSIEGKKQKKKGKRKRNHEGQGGDERQMYGMSFTSGNKIQRMNNLAFSKRKIMSPRKMRKRRCKNCVLCKKTDCGLCFTCLRNKNSESGNREVCLQKMCCEIGLERKIQPAIGFPPGWNFVFEAPKKASFRGICQNHNLNGLVIFAPNGRKYYSVESAAVHYSKAIKDVETVSHLFLSHIGIALHEHDPNHYLIGKGFCHEWTDVQGRNNVVFGVVTRCSKTFQQNNCFYFTIEYNNESLSLLNSFSGFRTQIPKFQHVPIDLAWGGCIAFERKMRTRHAGGSIIKSIDKTIGCKSWVTPDVRMEELVGKGDVMLPQLTLTVRGYKLFFTVKPSTIKNAGYGVFVKCTSLLYEMGVKEGKELETFTLRPGELLDLGVYAPFRAQDKKHECVFKLKNFLHSLTCEEWCFNSTEDDYQYDITDEITGKVHDLARQHIPMYVNECHINQIPSIYAEHDPEGSVHYLFGIAYNGDWDRYEQGMRQLNLKVGGDEVEVFVNYGVEYERVRLRKGYSAIPDEMKEQVINDLENDENDYVEEIEDFNQNELGMCLDYFLKSFVRENNDMGKSLQTHVRDKALEIARRMEKRAAKLLEQHSESGEMTDNWSVCSDLLRSAKELTRLLKSMICDHIPVIAPSEFDTENKTSDDKAGTLEFSSSEFEDGNESDSSTPQALMVV